MATPLNNSVIKAFRIMSLFMNGQREISTAIVVDQLGISQATAHRFLVSLEHAGAIRRTKRGYYALGTLIEELGWLAEENESLSQFLQPVLDDMSKELNESTMACRLTRHGPVCVAVANSKRTITVNIRVGTLLPLDSTAQGKLWLAEMPPGERKSRLAIPSIAGTKTSMTVTDEMESELEKVLAQGYALNLGGNEPDIAAVAVPVRNPDGKMVLTMSAFGMLSCFDQQFINRALQRLFSATDQISEII